MPILKVVYVLALVVPVVAFKYSAQGFSVLSEWLQDIADSIALHGLKLLKKWGY